MKSKRVSDGSLSRFFVNSKRGQVTIFIIIAILLVASVGVYFLVKSPLQTESVPSSLEPVYTSFLSCLEEDALIGVDILESQAGYIYLPDFESGSNYMPFGSQLNFLGNPVPYWYYVSRGNIPKEQIPSEEDMEADLERYVEEHIRGCVLDSYYDEGIFINMGEPKASIEISDDSLEIDLTMNLNMSRDEVSVLIKNHNVVVQTHLGSLYSSALKVYEQEQDTLFLENYAIDNLRTYAPVDGTELTCSPLTWNAEEIFDKLALATEVNTMALRGKNNDFTLTDENNKYFIVDLGVENEVRFLNSPNWASSYEVNPADGPLMIANAVGYQEGLGMLGFCYVPYHFVYSLKYPVLVQIMNGDEIFQFPLAVVVDKNKPREGLDWDFEEGVEIDVCALSDVGANIYTFDRSSSPVDANISFECFGVECEIGESSGGFLSTNLPQCVNGRVIAKSEGYQDSEVFFDDINSKYLGVVLDKLYDVDVVLKVDGKDYGGDAIITFVSAEGSKTVVYPEYKNVELVEGQYEIQIYVYRDSSLRLDATTYEQCYDVPASGFGSFVGLTTEECVTISLPSQIVSNALFAGGIQMHYVVESDLVDSREIVLDVDSFNSPESLEDLQQNYVLLESSGMEVYFR